MATAAALIIVATALLNPNTAAVDTNPSTLAVPDGHRVVSVPLDENIPPLDVGNEIDFYLASGFPAGLGSDASDVEVLGEPGLVVAIVDDALAVAVPQDVIAPLIASLADDAVLVVRR